MEVQVCAKGMLKGRQMRGARQSEGWVQGERVRPREEDGVEDGGGGGGRDGRGEGQPMTGEVGRWGRRRRTAQEIQVRMEVEEVEARLTQASEMAQSELESQTCEGRM